MVTTTFPFGDLDSLARLSGFEHDDGDLAFGPTLVGVEIGVRVHEAWPQSRSFVGAGLMRRDGAALGADRDVGVGIGHQVAIPLRVLVASCC